MGGLKTYYEVMSSVYRIFLFYLPTLQEWSSLHCTSRVG